MRLKRRSAVWLYHLDERILEHLDEGEPLTAWQLAYDLGSPSPSRVADRCRVLPDSGFVATIRLDTLDDKYDITGWGQRYLLGEVDADLRQPMPAPRPPEAVRPGWYAGFG